MSPTDTSARLDGDAFSFGFFEHVVYNHWSPFAVDLDADRERLLAADLDPERFDELRMAVAQFGAGEEAVTEDLLPLAFVTDDIEDELFLTSQIYEEAKHTAFFDRYWHTVLDPVADEAGYEPTSALDGRYFPAAYETLFERTHDAMHRLLDADTIDNRMRAVAHYHLGVESVLAQSGYYGIERTLDPDRDNQFPHLPGLLDGIAAVRGDEGRHVGYGIHTLHDLIHRHGGDVAVVEETLTDLLPLITGTLSAYSYAVDATELANFATERLSHRLDTLRDPHQDDPAVGEFA